MAHAINLNVDAHYVEQPGLFARLRQSFADYREYLATYEDAQRANRPSVGRLRRFAAEHP